MPFNYNTQGITNPDANDPRNLGGSEGYGNPTASGSSGIMSSTANTTSNDDDNEPSFFESIANLFSGAGADLPSDNNDDGDSGVSFYSGPMFGPFNNGSDDSGSDSNSNSTSPLNKPIPTSAADRAVYEALGIDVPEVYRGELGEWESEPNINVDVLQKALQPDPITVEEIEVKAGDTLSGIAKDKGVPVQDVINANPQIKNPDLIRPGEKVTVPDVYSGESTMERMARESAELAASKRDAAGITRSLTPEEVKQRNAALKAASEDPDRKFYQSTIPMEDRTFAEEAEQADGIMTPRLDTKGETPKSGTASTPKDAGIMTRRLTAEERTALSNVDEINRAQIDSITDQSGEFSNSELSSAIAGSVKNSTKQSLLKGAIEIETGGAGPKTEDNTYSLKAAKAVWTGVDSVLATLPADVASRLQYDYDKNLPRVLRTASQEDMQLLGEAMMEEKYDGGSAYKGRGLIQITGRGTYKAVEDVLKGKGINVDLVANPELVNDPAYALPAALAYLEYAGLDDTSADAMTAKELNNKINSGAGRDIAEERWEAVISDLRQAGQDEKADELELRNEYAAQVEVGLTGTDVDGNIGTDTKLAIDTWAASKGLTPPAVTPITKVSNRTGRSYQTYSPEDKLKLAIFVNDNS